MAKLCKKEYNDSNVLEYYEYIDNDIIIGKGLITNDESNKIYIYIEEEYRFKGYGSSLFLDLLKILDKEVKVKTDNIFMKRIINKCNGLELSKQDGTSLYVIPKIDMGD